MSYLIGMNTPISSISGRVTDSNVPWGQVGAQRSEWVRWGLQCVGEHTPRGEAATAPAQHRCEIAVWAVWPDLMTSFERSGKSVFLCDTAPLPFTKMSAPQGQGLSALFSGIAPAHKHSIDIYRMNETFQYLLQRYLKCFKTPYRVNTAFRTRISNFWTVLWGDSRV